MTSRASSPATATIVGPANPPPPVDWAMGRLASACAGHGISTQRGATPARALPGPIIIVTAPDDPRAAGALGADLRQMLKAPEALGLIPVTLEGRPAVIATGGDARGTMYAILELADRAACAACAAEALAAFDLRAPEVTRPANRIRSILRTLASDVADLPWFRDKTFWERYLTELATQRFNRLELATGIGFDFAVQMRDSYFYFAYPFLLAVPGYDVRAVGLPDAERDANLAMLRFIAGETKRRGLHFQLGLWAQVHEFQDSPNVNFPISGLNPANHATYCRDALRALLAQVPEIDGLTLRVHGESGIPERSYGFWETLFEAIAQCGRTLEIDMHAKGIDDRMIEIALATRQPVLISPKYWAEHLGLPYHQTDIRAVERPETDIDEHSVLMARSTGDRRFTRYGFADLLREDRKYGVLFRIWPGTQRILLWGDPTSGRAYSRAFGFCGIDGVEIFEPLSFAGRRGSGSVEGRDPYLDPALRPEGTDAAWEKYRYTYRLWGRLLYDPDADPENWRRFLRLELGAAAAAAESALASASRILPLVTATHMPSAANNRYWPEIYSSMPIVEGIDHYYSDTAKPRRFGNVSALDPEVFSTAEEYVDEVAGGRLSGRYSPLDVALRLEQCAASAERDLATAEAQGDYRPALRRLAIDVRMEAALGRFWAGKFRAAVGYAWFRRSGDRPTLAAALADYHQARDAFARVVALANPVYRSDLPFGPEPFLRGHWADRLPEIDRDLAAMTAELAAAPDRAGTQTLPIRPRPEGSLIHNPAACFRPGAPLPLEISVPHLLDVADIRLHYRHVTQAERFQSLPLSRAGSVWRATIPDQYTRSPFPLQYFFEVHESAGAAWRWPGIGPDLDQQPYLVIRHQKG